MSKEDEPYNEPFGLPDSNVSRRHGGQSFSESTMTLDGRDVADAIELAKNVPLPSQHHSLKHHLLGPSLTKAGQTGVDQKRVAEVIYEASKGSKYFTNEEAKDKNLTGKIERILNLKAQLDQLDLKQELRRADAYITELEIARDLSQYVVHIDCDAFYAAVEEIDRPDLKTVPMAVGQGVLTTCNYEARKFGCRSAMAGFVAKKLCPQLVCLPLNFEKYTAKAKEVRTVLAEYDPDFESSSIDEAYLNITDYCSTHNVRPEEAILQLRNEVHERCKITISAGIAPNAKIAKICSNKNKPNGQFCVPNDRVAVMSFIEKLPVRKVNGVGRVLERELDAIGVKTCGDIYEHRAYLTRLFGEKTSQFLLQTNLGLGRTDIQPADGHDRKSVGTESTFKDMSSKAELRSRLRRTAEELEKDMGRVGVKGRTLCLKIKLHTYEVFTRQVCPPKGICTADDLYNFALPMLAKLEKEIPSMRLRLMGLRCTHLISTKRADVDAFFARKGVAPTLTRESVTEEWESWPDEEFEEAARRERQTDFEESLRLSQEHEQRSDTIDDRSLSLTGAEDASSLLEMHSPPVYQKSYRPDWHEPFGRYKYRSASDLPNQLPLQQTDLKHARWDCPVCGVSQQASDRAFNEHIDMCLSRDTIKDAVAESTQGAPGDLDPLPVRSMSTIGTKRKAHRSADHDDRQKKLFFA